MATIKQDIAGARSTAQPDAMNAALKKAAQRGFPGLGGQGQVKYAKPLKQNINIKPLKASPKLAKKMKLGNKTPKPKKLKQGKIPTLQQVQKSVNKTMGYA